MVLPSRVSMARVVLITLTSGISHTSGIAHMGGISHTGGSTHTSELRESHVGRQNPWDS